MQKVAPAMMRSPRQAPGGASASPTQRAAATPLIAMKIPAIFLPVNCSFFNKKAINIVVSGRQESASEPRAAVV